MSFIEPRVAPVADLIDTAIARIPGRGAIQGTELLMLQGLLTMISTPESMVLYAQEIIDGRSNESILDCLIQPVSNKKKEKSNTKKNSKQAENPSSKLESYGLW